MRPPRNSFFKLCSCIFCIAYSLGDLNEHRPPSSVNQGTPSHLSIGTSSIHTTTWTEGTPSYTESSLSGSLGRVSADPGQFDHDLRIISSVTSLSPKTSSSSLSHPRSFSRFVSLYRTHFFFHFVCCLFSIFIITIITLFKCQIFCPKIQF